MTKVKDNLKLYGTISAENTTYNVTGITNNAFKGTAVKTVDLSAAYNLTQIYNGAFWGCKSLTSVKLSSSIKGVSNDSFRECTALKTFNFNGNSNITTIGDRMFMGDTALTSISIPYSVTHIWSESFKGSGLTEIKISNNVKNISYDAFRNCNKLKKITFEAGGSKQLYLGQHVFAGTTALQYVYLNREDIDAETNVFEGTNDNVSMQGYGSTSYTQSICKRLLKTWNLTYKTSYTNSQKKQFFTDLAKKVGSYVKAADIKEEGCAATVISVKKGTCGGYARVFYNCCIAAGVPNTDVLVGGDSHCHAWNYVKYGGYWYQVDCGWSRYCENAQQYYNLLKTWKDKNGNVPTAHRPENWIVCVDNMTGAEDENHYNNPYCKNFDQVLREGKANGISITGKRAGYPISNY